MAVMNRFVMQGGFPAFYLSRCSMLRKSANQRAPSRPQSRIVNPDLLYARAGLHQLGLHGSDEVNDREQVLRMARARGGQGPLASVHPTGRAARHVNCVLPETQN